MADEKTQSKKLERLHTVNLSKAYEYLRTRRTERAVKLLRAFLSRHFKVNEAAVRLSEGVNSLLWRDSIQKPPRRIKVRGVYEDGKLKAWLVGEEEAIAKAKTDAEKTKKEKEEKAKKKEDKPATASKPAEKKEEKSKESPSAPKTEEKSSSPASSPAIKAGDAKPILKSSGAMSGGRKQI